MSDDKERRKPGLLDPAYMKTEEEIREQIEYIKVMCKRISIVLAIAIALLLIGILIF